MRRALLVLATVVVAVAAVVGLLLFLSGRDQGGIDGGGDAGASASSGPGRELPDQGRRHLGPGDPAPHYATTPPASGPHRPVRVTRDGAALSDDQLLTALEAGDVVLLTAASPPPAALRAVQKSVSGAFSPGLARDGQAVVVGRRAGIAGVLALAWRRELAVKSPADPRLRQFADYWLGAGAP